MVPPFCGRGGCLGLPESRAWKMRAVSWRTEQRRSESAYACVYYYLVNNRVCDVPYVPGAVLWAL